MAAGDTPAVGERLRLTIPTVDFPEYSDSATFIKRGKWSVKIDGYTEFIPGDVIVVEGVWDGKKVVSDTVTLCQEEQCKRSSWVDKLLIGISYVRRLAVERLQRLLPEPMASLASGILLGVKALMPYDFYQQLVSTGTLHVIAASGFNVMIVASVLMAVVGKLWRRGVAIGVGIGGIVFYVLLAGGSASVVRAGIMGSLTLIAYYFGRPTEARRLLWITAGAMLLLDPAMLTDIGFQLSVCATMGLLYIGPGIQRLQSSEHSPIIAPACAGRQGSELPWRINSFLKEYFYPTLAATIATAPVIWWHFGRLSLISILVNMLILPAVPLIMLLSALTLIGGQMVAWVAYVPLAYLVWVIRWWG